MNQILTLLLLFVGIKGSNMGIGLWVVSEDIKQSEDR